MDNSTVWNIINTYFEDNQQALVRHHIDSYNDFFKNGIYQIFREKNPVVLYSKLDPETNEYMSQCKLYMGGKDGTKIYFGKPVIHDENNPHYMFPNEARLRDMNYSMTIHYDVDVEFIDKLQPGEMPTVIGGEIQKEIADGSIELVKEGETQIDENTTNELTQAIVVDQNAEMRSGHRPEDIYKQYGGASPKPTKRKKRDLEKIRFEMTTKAAERLREASESALSGNTQTRVHTLEKIFLGKFPIMVQSDFCVLQGYHVKHVSIWVNVKMIWAVILLLMARKKRLYVKKNLPIICCILRKWMTKNTCIRPKCVPYLKMHPNLFARFP